MGEPLAEIHEYLDLHQVMRARAEYLQISRTTIDTIAGVPDGYSGKLLAPSPLKCAGHKNLMPLLGALALKLVVVEDEEALAKIKRRLEPANHERQRFNNRNHETARAKQMNEAPRYRATADHTNLGAGFYSKGKEITWPGWPKTFSGSVEPVNEPARRVMQYWSKHRLDGRCPPSPYNAEHGRVFLPAHMPADSRSTRLQSLPREELPSMPKFRAVWRGEYGPRKVEIGEEVAFCGWPGSGLEPINDEAKRVVAYYEIYRDNPRLLSSPYCEYAQEIFLPPLPTAKRARGMNTSGDVGAEEFYAMREPAAPKPVAAARSTKRHGGTKRRAVA
ncbi:MAG: hypothetical protein GEU95_17620 [Rhizobiales bacterium]|nr:hypothetical protein [Hyphomicrobiales bacterium]